MREQTIQAIEKEQIIAILRGILPKDIIQTAEALYRGGIRLMEITFDRSGEIAPEVTCESIAKIAEAFAGKICVGAGTVTTLEDVEMAHRAGAAFLISPNTNEAVIRRTVELDMVSIPGALTPTEIVAAHDAGADFVKLFPAGNMGAAYVKAVCAPLNDIRMLAVGGINAKNAADYVKAGCRGVGVGGNLANRSWIEKGEFDKIEAVARELVDALDAKGEF